MSDRGAPRVYTIPLHRAFADALVKGIVALHGGDHFGLARGTILVPNNRAAGAITDAFVRHSENGLLLPRMVAIGDPDLDERAGAALDVIDDDPIPPAVDPLQRQFILARLVQQEGALGGRRVDAAEAMRLAGDLARTLDQLIIDEISPSKLLDVGERENLSSHWQTSLDLLNIVLKQWPAELKSLARIDLADRRNRQLDRVAARWRTSPPSGFVVAAGVSTAAPAVTRLLKTVASLPEGRVVLAGLDLAMPDAEWAAVAGDGDHAGIETHPQYHLALMLGGLGVARAEVEAWRWGGETDARAARSKAISNALAPAAFTGKWIDLSPDQRDLAGVRALELSTPADEAQAIAIALREAIETPEQTAALVSPDRDLARRVSAHLKRWGIEADDSAGLPLSATPAGTLILTLATAIAQQFAPVPLLALVKHPLVHGGIERQAWLDGARDLDRALRGPRPSQGLASVTAFLMAGEDRDRAVRDKALAWWRDALVSLEPIEGQFAKPTLGLKDMIAALQDGAQILCGDAIWSGSAGRAVADLITNVAQEAELGPLDVTLESVVILLRQLMDGIAVRPAQSSHSRIAIWGLLEAKLQSANLMILGGLNEGVWPSLPSPDPWLAPAIRKSLGLPSLERRIGLSAHDLAGAMGAQKVLLTRALRDARAPTIASRFWLRLEAMSGGLKPPTLRYDALAHMIDAAAEKPKFAKRPMPKPDAGERPRRISITDVDRLNADPYAFYAKAMLGLSALDPVDADPGPAWRGTLIHAVLQDWAEQDEYRPDALPLRMANALSGEAAHPLIRALWLPRLIDASHWIARQVSENADEGRMPVLAEQKGAFVLHGVELYGRVDRIDQCADGSIAVIDYKTGQPPSDKQVKNGFALQLGLTGLIAENGGFPGVNGKALVFEYWSLSKAGQSRSFGWKRSPTTGKGDNKSDPEKFVAQVQAQFLDACGKWLTGNEAFTAKLHPEYAWQDYDHLMRLEEWEGRHG